MRVQLEIQPMALRRTAASQLRSAGGRARRQRSGRACPFEQDGQWRWCRGGPQLQLSFQQGGVGGGPSKAHSEDSLYLEATAVAAATSLLELQRREGLTRSQGQTQGTPVMTPRSPCGPRSGPSAARSSQARRGHRSACLPAGQSCARAGEPCWCRGGRGARAGQTSGTRRPPW